MIVRYSALNFCAYNAQWPSCRRYGELDVLAVDRETSSQSLFEGPILQEELWRGGLGKLSQRDLDLINHLQRKKICAILHTGFVMEDLGNKMELLWRQANFNSFCSGLILHKEFFPPLTIFKPKIRILEKEDQVSHIVLTRYLNLASDLSKNYYELSAPLRLSRLSGTK